MARSSFVERNKAIRKAWIKEQELVQAGNGTRKWTQEQQIDILEKGRAYDEKGKAFEGQHMKSAEEYPEYQGNPDNIQFLTRAEHLEAHDGSWQNPTNWYFDPITKEKIDFGDGTFIPCKTVPLPEPVVKVNTETGTNNNQEDIQTGQKTVPNSSLEKGHKPHKKIESQKFLNPKAAPPIKSRNIFISGLKTSGRFIVEHPIESLEIASVAIGGAVKVITSIRKNGSGGTNKTTSETKTSNIVDKVTDIVEKASKSLPCENDVSGHPQRYHTKNGVEWRNKGPYHRGGNKDE